MIKRQVDDQEAGVDDQDEGDCAPIREVFARVEVDRCRRCCLPLSAKTTGSSFAGKSKLGQMSHFVCFELLAKNGESCNLYGLPGG